MSRMICVMGESGSGKTTSMRTLNPATTYYIDCDCKGLNWKGWRSSFNSERKNYFSTRDISCIGLVLSGVAQNRPEIKTIVVDTLNTAMVESEVLGMREKGYEKWVDLAQNVWNVCRTAASLREDLTVIIVMHSETVRDDLGYSFTRVKTNGRKLEKIVLESLFSTVLLAKCSNGKYVFETRANNSTAKTPMGAFDDAEIDNDMSAVLNVLEEF